MGSSIYFSLLERRHSLTDASAGTIRDPEIAFESGVALIEIGLVHASGKTASRVSKTVVITPI